MSIRTTVTLDDDVVSRLKQESKARDMPFRELINEAIRTGLMTMKSAQMREPYVIVSVKMGCFSALNYDNIGELIELAEGGTWR